MDIQKRKTNMKYWNHRVVTHIYKGIIEDERLFSIVEVYYKKGKAVSYTESRDILGDLTSKKDLKWTNKKIKKAFKKPILDLDNFPKKWKDK